MKQTAVEWLLNEISTNDWWYLPQSMKKDIIEQAKEMEKEQKIEFAEEYSAKCSLVRNGIIISSKSAEEYYNETFK